MKRKSIVKLLKDLNGGQGFSAITCHYDSAAEYLTFGISVSRERDGLTFGPIENLTEEEFYKLLDRLTSE